jgi:hypothetical protein
VRLLQLSLPSVVPVGCLRWRLRILRLPVALVLPMDRRAFVFPLSARVCVFARVPTSLHGRCRRINSTWEAAQHPL